MGWKDDTFPSADDPQDVSYMIMYWRTVECSSGCKKQDYRLESRQFDHLPKGVTYEQAQILFNKYVDERRATGDQVNRKSQTLFLCEVKEVALIHDRKGKAVKP